MFRSTVTKSDSGGGESSGIQQLSAAWLLTNSHIDRLRMRWMSVNCENEKVSDTASYYTDTYEDNNQDWHNDIWTTQYSHFTLDWRGWQGCRCKFSDVVAAHKIVLATHRDRFESGVSGSVVAWTSYTRARPCQPSGGVASLPCGLGWQRRGQSPRTSARSTPSWRTGAGGGLGPSPLDSTLVSITCHKLIELNMLICRF